MRTADESLLPLKAQPRRWRALRLSPIGNKRRGRARHARDYWTFSSSGATLISPPVIFNFRSQALYPFFFTTTM